MFILLVLCLPLNSCEVVGLLGVNELRKANKSFKKAIEKLEKESDEWQDIALEFRNESNEWQDQMEEWQDIVDELQQDLIRESDEWQEIVKYDIPNRIDKIVDDALLFSGTLVLCLVDNTVDRVITSLKEVLQEITNNEFLIKPEPTICASEQTSISLSNPNDLEITLVGFDIMNDQNQYYVTISKSNRTWAFNSDIVTRQHDYQLTINLQDKKTLLQNAPPATLTLLWGDKVKSEFRIIE